MSDEITLKTFQDCFSAELSDLSLSTPQEISMATLLSPQVPGTWEFIFRLASLASHGLEREPSFNTNSSFQI